MVQAQARLRTQLLAALYAQRMAQPHAGWLTEAELRDAVGVCEFALSVLAEIGLAKKDGFRYHITGMGVLVHEAQEPA